jgi:hypothetical protein
MDNTLHSLIAQLGELRAEKKRLEYDLNEVKKHIATKEYEIMDAMDDQQITESKSEAGKVILGEAIYPQVQDWDEVYHWQVDAILTAVKEGHDPYMDNSLHFFEKRMGVLAYREALDRNIPVPGVLPFTKRKITFKET